jgi:hypothetical protein
MSPYLAFLLLLLLPVSHYRCLPIRAAGNGEGGGANQERSIIFSKPYASILKKPRGNHGLINSKDTEVKRRHLKIFTCKRALRQVFIFFRVYKLEINSVMLVHISTQLCELLPL